jgi:hypothetical protein
MNTAGFVQPDQGIAGEVEIADPLLLQQLTGALAQPL